MSGMDALIVAVCGLMKEMSKFAVAKTRDPWRRYAGSAYTTSSPISQLQTADAYDASSEREEKSN